LTGQELLTVGGCLREPRERGRRQTQPPPRNNLARPDHLKGREEGMETASPVRGNGG